jgi:(p)ppGpp synthase/HD superfamily hydrolase
VVNRRPGSRAAAEYAEQQHAGQERTADGAPFILHVLEVGSLLDHAGAPDHVVVAGILHDTLEKTATDSSELRRRFGPEVAKLVIAVSEDKRIPRYQARKAALRRQVAAAGRDALTLFAADKVSKARELQLEASIERIPRRARERRLGHYRQCLKMLQRNLPGSPLVAQLRAELDQLLVPSREQVVEQRAVVA